MRIIIPRKRASSGMTLSYHKVVVWLCLHIVGPNAGRQPLPEAGARYERTLEAVGWTPWLGAAPSPVRPRQAPPSHDRQGIGGKMLRLFMPRALRAERRRGCSCETASG